MAGVRRILCVGVVLEILLVFEVKGQGEQPVVWGKLCLTKCSYDYNNNMGL